MTTQAQKRATQKGRRESGTFVLMPHAFIASPAYQGLSLAGRRVFDILFLQLRYDRGTGANNNGWLSCTSVDAAGLGITSHDTITKGLLALETSGIIFKTKQGSYGAAGRRVPNLYAITLWSISRNAKREKERPLDVAVGTPVIGKWLARDAPTGQPEPDAATWQSRVTPPTGAPLVES